MASRQPATLQRCNALEDTIAVDEGMDVSRRDMREEGREQQVG